MKKFLTGLLCLMLLTSCNQAKEEAPKEDSKDVVLNVLSPKGAPAISTIPYRLQHEENVEYVAGPDLLQAAFINPEPQYDVIIAPTNLGCKLASIDKTSYKLIGVVTWGNLYLVGSDVVDLNDETKTLAAFGEQAVPSKVLETRLPDLNLNIDYYPSVSEAQAALLTNKADVALLAEPLATATIAKGKTLDLELSILQDLQNIDGMNSSYPQAGIFVNTEKYDENSQAYQEFVQEISDYLTNVASDTSILTKDIDEINPETLGLPSSELIAKTYSRLGLRYESSIDAKDALNEFLQLFAIENIEKTIIE